MSRWAAALIFGALLGLGVGTDATAQSRVTGKVVDAEGNAVTDITIRFTLLNEEETSRTVNVRKKGRFAESRLSGGRYRVDLVESDLFVTRVDYDIRRADGLSVGAGQIDGHPRSGVVGVPVSKQNEVRLTLVVVPRGSAEARERELVLSSPELSAAAKLYNKGEYEQAVDEAERVLAGNPELDEAFYIRGVALEKLGRYAEAESVLQQAAGRMPDYPRIWAALGEVSMNLAAEQESRNEADEAKQAYGRAAEALTKAVERDSDTLALQINLAASLDRTGEEEQLLQVLERILEQDPTNIQARVRLAGLYARQGKRDVAMAMLDEVPDTETRAAVTIYNIAVGLNDGGDIEGSLLAARRAAEIDPQLPHPRRLIAQNLLGKNDHPAAIEAIGAFLELAPDDPEADVYRRILTQLEEQ
jgi:tetratricopeptide (TPR) repeat protein